MKIIVIDGYAMNPGDLNWGALNSLGTCRFYERSTREQVVERCRGAQCVLTNKVVFSEEVMAALPELRYIGVTATGYNVVDIEAARRRNITVTNVPAYSTASVAQMVFALLLELTQQVGRHSELVGRGDWTKSPDFCFWDRPLVELEGRVMGLVGFGQIARRVAAIAQALGMEVSVYTRHPERHTQEFQSMGCRAVDLDTMFSTCDVISLHCPLTPETAGLVSEERLRLMRPGAFLINTARGPLVDEQALAAALNSGQLGGAGLDVLSSEPPLADNPLLQASNCFITPHIAWATKAARQRLLTVSVENLAAFLAGEKRNVVS